MDNAVNKSNFKNLIIRPWDKWKSLLLIHEFSPMLFG